MSSPAAEARHRIANLLHTYVAIADRKDVNAVVDLLGRANVQFPTAESSNPVAARELFTRLWSAPEGHRHDVSNLIVHPGPEDGQWLATAHYTRWLLAGDAPLLHTLGAYQLLVNDGDWSIQLLKVNRVWTAGS
ncbi:MULTISPECIES: nuclear transport factor 2 family protein [unclassified Arthrobacter]|uniref:nuclear transport factor 2 family protein n=1 Tax=unclassified Arthrobacter TaxID=235627 RepID=UPI001C84149E|nr:nuclear transport factor 2 family protein [Arthrobacter sp. MAHUQ-56]MBX7445907.1 nuclear transport factor 2 family protein [Arthrobacter sp. MAHUQ-56]